MQVDGRRVRHYGVADGLPSDAATALLESGNGTVWIGTQKGLARRQSDGRIVTVAGSDAPSPLAMTTLTGASRRCWSFSKPPNCKCGSSSDQAMLEVLIAQT